MRQYLLHIYSLLRFVGHHPHKEVLEVIREEIHWLVLVVRLPKHIVLFLFQGFIEGVGD
jgi:hypothetical protein